MTRSKQKTSPPVPSRPIPAPIAPEGADTSVDDEAGRTSPMPGAATVSVLVYESGKTNQKRAEELVRGLGYRALVIDSLDEAVRLAASDTPPEVILTGVPGGEAVARAARQQGGDRPSVVLAVSGQSHDAAAQCEALGADAFVVRPYKRDAVASTLRVVSALHGERRRSVRLEAELSTERARLLRHGEADPTTGFPHFEFFKKLLVIELKRARRYGYSLAACLVSMDVETVDGISAAAQKAIHADIARRLRSVIRDIDLPVDYADGKFLVFLPYTDIAGAKNVGNRLEAAVRGDTVEDGERTVAVTVSVGIAALKPGRVVSFARLIRDASLALRAAQLKGGGRVVAKE
jgi:diguanylate cyclase (GGDEF)-like protein